MDPANLIKVNCQVLKELVEKVQALNDDDPCLSSFLEAVSDPATTQEEMEAAVIARDVCLANLRDERLAGGIISNPSAPETGDEFDKYVAKYGDATLHNYDGAPDVSSVSSSLRTMNDNSARQAQFQEWAAGCGSAPEFLWLRGDICPCDSKKLIYIDNGIAKENDSFFILPNGKVPSTANNIFGNTEVSIVINGKIVKKRIITTSRPIEIQNSAIVDMNIQANLKQKVLIVSATKKQGFLYTTS